VKGSQSRNEKSNVGIGVFSAVPHAGMRFPAGAPVVFPAEMPCVRDAAKRISVFDADL
jgi:hypothetical protein